MSPTTTQSEDLPRWVWFVAIALIVIGIVYLTFQPKSNQPVVSSTQDALIRQATK